mgnify:FL=1
MFQTDHFSCGKVSVDEDIWEYKSPIPQTPPQPDPPMPKLTSEIKSVDCTVLHPGFEIYCGKANGGDLSYTNSETDKSHIIANIQAELSQTFGIDSGKVYEMVLGKMAAELNLKYSAGLAGGGEWTNASSRTLSVDHGDEYRRCAFGSMQVIQLNVEVEFKLDGVSMGTVTKEDGLMLCAKDPWVFDPTCPGCEIEIPIRPYTPMPSSCAD